MNNKVAIIIPTKNRSEFLIRQLRYYSSLKCKHPIYICDGSGQQESDKIKNEINKLANLEIKYLNDNGQRSTVAISNLIKSVKEDYFTFSGDDDFQVPDSLSACADFLDKNSDYSSASGYAVSFRLKEGTAVRGHLGRLADYPRGQYEQNSAADRLTYFMKNFYTSTFSVNRVSSVRPYLDVIDKIEDNAIAAEWLPCALIVVAGKTKLLNILGFVRQLHYNHDTSTILSVEKMTTPEWSRSYMAMSNLLVRRLLETTNLNKQETVSVVKNAIGSCVLLTLQQVQGLSSQLRTKKYGLFKLIKRKIAIMFPWIKSVYYSRRNRPINVHYQVLEPKSLYYKDFLPIYKSITY